MRASIVVLCALSLAGCQCDYRYPDGGGPGGTDAGGADASGHSDGSTGDAGSADAGGPDGGGPDGGTATCATAGDCSGPRDSVGFCSKPGWSCVASACLYECEGRRTCNFTASGCFVCDNGAPACNASLCGPTGASARVEMNTHGCDSYPGTTGLFNGQELQVKLLGGCANQVALVNGPVMGTFQELTDNELLADFAALGGRCTGGYLPTGALRVVFNCPACQFVVVFH
jgi:hypothetical protein